MTHHTVGLLEVFLVVSLSTIFSLGGGNGPLAVIQDRWVSKGLLDPGLFAWSLALSYLSPGPKAGFVAGIGYYMYGAPGAAVAVAGIALPTLLGSAAVSYAYRRLEPAIHYIALPASFAVAGMIAAAAWNTALPMKLAPAEIAAVAGVALLVGLRNLDPVIVVLGSAAVGFLWWLL